MLNLFKKQQPVPKELAISAEPPAEEPGELDVVTHSVPERETISVDLPHIIESMDNLGLEITDAAGQIGDVAENSEEMQRIMNGLLDASGRVESCNADVRQAVSSATEIIGNTQSEMSNSSEAISDSLDKVSRLSAAIEQMNGQLAGLQESFSNIREVAGAIDAIARQTNLLALNATIEAARAGEAGKGFAVVASEVKALATQTSAATEQIDSTIQELGRETDSLTELGQQAIETVSDAKESARTVSEMIEGLSSSMVSISNNAVEIETAVTANSAAADELQGNSQQMEAVLAQNAERLSEVCTRITQTVDGADTLIGETAHRTGHGRDSEMIQLVLEMADTVAQAFEQELQDNRITPQALFAYDYEPIPGTDPEQVMAPFTEMTDRVLPALQEPMLERHEAVAFCAVIDLNGYLPTHNKKFSKPQGSDPVWNTANCRNRRIFNDKTGLSAGQNTKPFLLQTYRRDMGGGEFVLMKDVSAPIMVQGRHWGAVRIGYKVD
ncbi:MAG: methyl-accepting chemotaxis protein [Stappiaceae bacterium]